MHRSVIVGGYLASLLIALPLAAKITGANADGTWDCIDQSDKKIGSVVIADTTYAFLNLDGTVAGYGKMDRVSEDFLDLPAFAILDGYLKDEMAALGMSTAGPRENFEDFSGEHFLSVIITVDNKLYCTRRKAPAA